MHAGIGTHIDAPSHCVPNGSAVDDLPLSSLIAPCVVIDVSQNAHESYRVTPQDIKEFEKEHGQINSGSVVMIRTSWDRFWRESERYRNNFVFPTVSGDAAELLLERGINGLGVDTLSPDRPETHFPVHQLLLSANKYIIENATNLCKLPPQGSVVLALPMKTKGTEAPMRLIGLIKV